MRRFDTVVLPTGDRARITLPDSTAHGDIVVYLHGRSGSEASLDEPDRAALRDALLAAGYLLASPAMHGDAWGNRTAQDDLVALDAWLDAYGYTGRRFLLGESMGAGAAANALRLGEIPVAGVVMIAPSLSLTAVWDRGEAGRESLTSAYELAPDGADVAERTHAWDPIRHDARRYRRAPILVFASAEDRIAALHTVTGPWVAAVRTAGLPVDLVRVRGGHVSDDHIRPGEVVGFFDRLAGRGISEP
ncbi:alpha/beta hydrolase [Rhodococcus sp. HNM0569]|uniref:alpha/beta hydrolase family protein n=1 Tax=Rhodococcus sp. HNM0569 TaxID=2716340 RepID=UPI00146A8D5A|nr:alpha/beta hydrolase [Rhodococcus sp. HNM0569]NLU84828.1 alpha/beta hydrolase [Rhodococcus sp. HNM0569]